MTFRSLGGRGVYQRRRVKTGEDVTQTLMLTYFFFSCRTTPYVVALVIAKFLHTFGLFVTYEQLKVVHVVQFLFIIRVWYVSNMYNHGLSN